MTDEELDVLYEKGRIELQEKFKDKSFKDFVFSIKVGDRVKVVSNLFKKGSVGIVTEVFPLNEENPILEHGSIEVDFGLGEGKEEHWCHYKWWHHLRIL